MPPRRGEARTGALRRGPGAGRIRLSRAAFLSGGLALLALLPLGRKGVALWLTVPAHYGRVTVAVEGEALVVREERVIFAEVAGEVRPVAQEGERVPRGALVARIVPLGPRDHPTKQLEQALDETGRRAILDEQSPLAGAGGGAQGASSEALAAARRALEEEQASLARPGRAGTLLLRAASAGTVSYVVDGLEGILGPGSLPDLLNDETPVVEVARGAEPRVVQSRATVAAGQAVAKVVDNFRVWFVVDLPAGAVGPALPQAGARVELRLRGAGAPEGATCTGTVVSRRDRKEGTRLVLAPVEYWPEFGRVRRTTLELRLGDFEGVVVPRSAVLQRGGTSGVVVEAWFGRQFQPVTVRGGDRERVAVDGLAPGTRVWKKPDGKA